MTAPSPVILSLLLEPVTFSIPVNVSFPSPPEDDPAPTAPADMSTVTALLAFA